MIKYITAVFLTLSNFSAGEIETYRNFYYADKKILEARLNAFLKDPPGILMNYPVSPQATEQEVESNFIATYELSRDLVGLENDLTDSINKEDYYGFIMISASLYKKDYISKFIEIAINSIGKNRARNAIIAFGVLNVINKDYFFVGDQIDKDSLKHVRRFVEKLRKYDYNSRGYELLKKVDSKIIESCFFKIS